MTYNVICEVYMTVLNPDTGNWGIIYTHRVSVSPSYVAFLLLNGHWKTWASEATDGIIFFYRSI